MAALAALAVAGCSAPPRAAGDDVVEALNRWECQVGPSAQLTG